jgi:uncharacterized NAD-dependent epimerase/dehydratase family protein
MSAPLDGKAVVYCAGRFGSTYGKTAHGLVRFTRRYRVLSVIDPELSGRDAGEVLDGKPAGIPVVGGLPEAFAGAGEPATHFVIGLAPDGGVLDSETRGAVREALEAGLDVDSGLHEFLSDDPDLAALAAAKSVVIRDVRKTPPRSQLHGFSGKIEEVRSLKAAVLGPDSAIGKRTTAWILVHALERSSRRTEFIGTGQTAWMQGARYGIILDSLVNDFVAGEIEHAVWTAWKEQSPEVIVVEGQGSLMNPAYPGGYEILAAARPDAVVLQHAPARLEYDGFPGYRLHPLTTQIQAIELVSGRPVVAITVNHEGLEPSEVPRVCREITGKTGLPCCDPLLQPVDPILEALLSREPGPS